MLKQLDNILDKFLPQCDFIVHVVTEQTTEKRDQLFLHTCKQPRIALFILKQLYNSPYASARPELQHFLVSRSRLWGAFSQLRLKSQDDKKCYNFEEALVTNNGNIEFVECAYHLKSYVVSNHFGYCKWPNCNKSLCL